MNISNQIFAFQVPEDIQCSDSLHGKTHTSEGVIVEGDREWSYGHIIEFCLEMNTGTGKLFVKKELFIVIALTTRRSRSLLNIEEE